MSNAPMTTTGATTEEVADAPTATTATMQPTPRTMVQVEMHCSRLEGRSDASQKDLAACLSMRSLGRREGEAGPAAAIERGCVPSPQAPTMTRSEGGRMRRRRRFSLWCRATPKH